MFLLLLCNDREVLGPWVNRAWLNALASVIMGVLLMLSLILMVRTLFPGVNVPRLTLELAIVLGIGLIGFAIAIVVSQRRLEAAAPRGPEPPRSVDDAPGRPAHTTDAHAAGAAGMLVLRSYLVVAVLLLIIKAIELAN